MIKFSSSAVNTPDNFFTRLSASDSSFAAVCFIPEDHPLHGKSFSEFDPYTVGLPPFKYDEEDVVTSIVRENFPQESCIIILLNNDLSLIWSANYANNIAQQFAVNLSKIDNYSNSVQNNLSNRLYSFGLL